jgi:hypothetical protein
MLKSSNHSIGERRTGGDWPYTLRSGLKMELMPGEGRNWALTRTVSSDMTDDISQMAFGPAQERLKRREGVLYAYLSTFIFLIVLCGGLRSGLRAASPYC